MHRWRSTLELRCTRRQNRLHATRSLADTALDPTRHPLHLSSSAKSVSDAAIGSTTDGVWAIAGGSFAGFRCQVSLLGRMTSLVGQSNALVGGIEVIDGAVEAGSFRINLSSLRILGKPNALLNRMIDTPRYPFATFVLDEPISIDPSPSMHVTYRAPARGSLTMRGQTRPVSFTFAARYTGTALEGTGSIAIRFSDWHLKAPFGVQNTGAIDFTLRMRRSTSQPSGVLALAV